LLAGSHGSGKPEIFFALNIPPSFVVSLVCKTKGLERAVHLIF